MMFLLVSDNVNIQVEASTLAKAKVTASGNRARATAEKLPSSNISGAKAIGVSKVIGRGFTELAIENIEA